MQYLLHIEHDPQLLFEPYRGWLYPKEEKQSYLNLICITGGDSPEEVEKEAIKRLKLIKSKQPPIDKVIEV